MTALSTRSQAIFEKTKTLCFGRFVIDIPESATLAWGQAILGLDLNVYPDGLDEVNRMAQDYISSLKSKKAINHNHVPLLLAINEINDPPGKIVVGYEDFQSIDDLAIRAYFNFGMDGAVIQARPLRPQMEETILLIKSMAGRLRHRTENEIPDKPGNCIEHVFLLDAPNPTEEDLLEHVRIGLRLKEFPDAHLSIYIAPSNPHNPEGDSLAAQFKRIKEDPMTPEEKKVLDNTKFFRESPRKIHDWTTGYEVLMRTPDEEESLSHHDFRMKFIGVPHDPLRPYADIQFQTGIADNAAGAGKASLTDEEAIAIWDTITSTIRLRPTGPAAANVSDTTQSGNVPLGELAATGRTCPQTGWWVPSEEDAGKGAQRRHIEAGERMPHLIASGTPSIWQKLKGERPSYRSATVWKLVGYGESNDVSSQRKG